MFENLVHQLLSGYLGRYVKGLQREQFKIALWKGEVVLENVELILEAFDYLQLPFAIKNGRIGRMCIKIPWTKLGWDPIIISLDDVFICTAQRDDSEWSPESVESREFAGKKAKLAAAELAKLTRRVCDNQSGQSFISYMSAKILDNVQVSVQRLHVTFVDASTDSDGQFVFGFRLSSLTVMTDTRPKGTTVGSRKIRGGQVCKRLDISEFGIYWNPWADFSSSSIADFHGAQSHCSRVPEIEEYKYIIKPFDATISLMVNKSGKFEKGIPHYCVMSELNFLVISLNEIQLQQVLMLLDSFAIGGLRQKYGRYRPWHNPLLKKLSGWQITWWHYAQNAVLSDVRKKLRKNSWHTFGQRINLRRKYVDLYKKKLLSLKDEQPVSKGVLNELDLMEKECDLEDILSYRFIAETQLQVLLSESNISKADIDGTDSSSERQQIDDLSTNRPRGWLNWLSLGMLGAGGTIDSDQFAGVVSDEIIEDIYKMTKFNPISTTDVPISFLEKFHLSSISFSIHQVVAMLVNKRCKKDIVTLMAHSISFQCDIWDDSAKIVSSISSLQMLDPCSKKAWLFDKNEKVVLLPVEVVCDPELVAGLLYFSQVLGCFESHYDMVLSSLNYFENIKTRLSKKAEFILMNRAKLTLDVSLSNAVVRIPLKGNGSTSHEMVFVLGELLLGFHPDRHGECASVFESLPDFTDSSIINLSGYMSGAIEMLYDAYCIKLVKCEGLVAADSSQLIPVFDILDASIVLKSSIIQDECLLKQLEVDFHANSMGFRMSASLYRMLFDLQNWLVITREVYEQATKERSEFVTISANRSKFDTAPDRYIFNGDISAAVKCITVHVDLEDGDPEKSIKLAVTLGQLDLSYVCEMLIQKFAFSTKEMDVKAFNSGGQSLGSLIFLNRESFRPHSDIKGVDYDPNVQSEKLKNVFVDGSFTFQWRRQRSADSIFDEVMIFITNADIHCYPRICGLLLNLFEGFDEQDGQLTAYSTGTLHSSKMGLPKSNLRCGVGPQRFGFSNFSMNGVHGTESIPLDQFPFLSVCSLGLVDTVESSLPFRVDDWRKTFSLKDCKSSSVSHDKFVYAKNFLVTSLRKKSSHKFGATSAVGSPQDTDQLVLDVDLSGIKVHFHDSSCILATVTMPALRSLSSFHGADNWDILLSTEGLSISSSWCSPNFHGNLFGPALPTHPPVVNVRVQKNQTFVFSKIELGFSIQHTCCILPAELLAAFIGYFSLPEWTLTSKEQFFSPRKNTGSKHCEFSFKFEVLDSALVLPSENDIHYPLKMGIQQLHCCVVPELVSADALNGRPSSSVMSTSGIRDMTQVVNLFGQGLSLSLILLKDDLQMEKGYASLDYVVLVETCNIDLQIKIPSGASSGHSLVPAVTACIDSVEVVAAGRYFLGGLEAVSNAIDELSSVSMQSQCFTSDILQFRLLKRNLVKSLSFIPEVPMDLCMDTKVSIKALSVKLLDFEGLLSSQKAIAKANMGINFSASFQHETLICLDIEISDFILHSTSDSVVLAAFKRDFSPSSLDIRISLSEEHKHEISLEISSLHVWLYLVEWMEIFDLLYSYAQDTARTTSMTSFHSSDPSEQSASLGLNSSDLSLVTSFARSTEDISEPSHYLSLQSKCICIYFHFPIKLNVEADPLDEDPNIQKGSFSEKCFVSENNGTLFASLNSNLCKYIVLSLESRDTKLDITGKVVRLDSCIEKVEGRLEKVDGSSVHSIPFFLLLQIKILMEACMKEGTIHASINAHLGTLDMWFSYYTFHFCNGAFQRVPEVKSSQALAVIMIVNASLKKSTLLLSDGRWSCSGPVMEILTRNLFVRANHDHEILKASVEGDLLVNYNNIHKVAWEPFVEPWSFNLMLVRKLEKDGLVQTLSGTEVHLTSTAHLNINVTESLFEVVYRGMQMINDAWSRHGVDDTELKMKKELLNTDGSCERRYAPYIIQNDTCLPLLFWIFEDNKKSSFEANVEILVQPGSSVPIYIEESPEENFFHHRSSCSFDRFDEKRSHSAQHHMISIQIEGTSGASAPMSMDLVGLSYFEVDFSKRSDLLVLDGRSEACRDTARTDKSGNVSEVGLTVPVAYEVSIQHYSKLIRLYSTVIFHNATSMPLELRFDIPFGISPKILDPILPGQELPLPVHLAESGRMRWRPLGSDFLWSEAQTLLNILSPEIRTGTLRSSVCYPSLPSKDPFRCCIAVHDIPLNPPCFRRFSSTGNLVQPFQNTSKLKKRFIRQIKLITPLVVKNYLPVALKCTIVSSGVPSKISIPEVDTVFVSHIDSSHDLGITFYLDGFQPSFLLFPRAETVLSTSKSNEERFSSYETVIFYPDVTKGGPPICVDVEKGMSTVCGAREISVSVPYLLYNCTGLTLVIADADNRHKENACLIPSSYSLIWGKQLLNDRRGLAQVSCEQGSSASIDVIDSQDVFPSYMIPYRERPYCSGIFHKQLQTSSPLVQGQKHIDHLEPDVIERSSFCGFARKQRASSQLVLPEVSRSFVNVGIDARRKVKACMYSSAQGHSSTEKVVLSICMPGSTNLDTLKSKWSNPLFLASVTGSTSIVIPQPDGSGAFIVSVTSSPISGAFAGRSRMITFQPRYVISNSCNKDLYYKQKGCDSFYILGVGKHCHLHLSDAARELLVSIRFDEPGWQWSGGFLPDQLGDTLVKMHNYITGAFTMVRVEVQNADVSIKDEEIVGSSTGGSGTYLILLSDDNTGFMPYRIDNFSMDRLRIYQQNCERFESIVHPYTSCSYAWDEPQFPHRLLVEVPGECFIGAYNIDIVKEYTPIHLPTVENPERTFFLSVHAEGAVKVLSVMDLKFHSLEDMKEPGLYGSKRRKGLEQMPEKILFNEKITVSIPFIGISLIDSTPQELIFASARELKIEMLQTLEQQKLFVQVLSLQIDNQLRSTVCPIILSIDHESCSIPQQKRVEVDITASEKLTTVSHDGLYEPVFFLTATKWRNDDNSLVSFKNISLRLAPLHIELEEQILLSVLNFVNSVAFRQQADSTLEHSVAVKKTRENVEKVSHQCRYVRDDWYMKSQNGLEVRSLASSTYLGNQDIMSSLPCVVPIGAPWQQIFLLARRQRKIYVEEFYVSPFWLTISFSSSPWMQKPAFKSQKPVIHLSNNGILRVLIALVDIEEAPIYLRQLTILHHLASWEAIQDIVIKHYTRQLFQELYKVFWSAGVIGNPMGFVRNVGLGIKEFILVPVKGVWQSPGGLFQGVLYGTQSLLGNTIYAISNATTQFSRAARKGVVAFAFDEQSVGEMERRQMYHGSHGKGILDDILEGFTGLLQSPIQGAERHGLPGALSGMVSGTAKLIARPIVSVLELTGRTAMSIRNRSGPRQAKLGRVRVPRPVSRELPLRPYSLEEAVGISMLIEADDARFRDEFLVTCKALKQAGNFVIVTRRLMLVVKCCSLTAVSSIHNPEWVVELEMDLYSIVHIDTEGETLNIVSTRTETAQGQQKTSHLKRWKPRSIPLVQRSIEMPTVEAAREVLQILWTAIDGQKHRGLKVHLLHRNMLR
ncbi:uncharacterized protein LOC116247732 isoform X3 [Nymphaea colorata]|uniref:uncharacterized protein LOC116247732 isoform X3 n=1 Tax=Nymphaea colorata TaxID=210225 RepID=UPI00129E99ED|nr:uncharacterized protein LOC116247732 isoform X3 [Nymphaea colorata]